MPKLVEPHPVAVIVMATGPPEPLPDAARQLARHDRVMGSGTHLYSLRFRPHVAERLGVDPADVRG